jgi:hypothetical protein
MTALAESSSATVATVRPISAAALNWHGIRAGFVGGITLAVWFLFVDFNHGRPLYTPTLLGSKLLGEGGMLPPVLSFTIVHFLIFGLVGIAAAHLVGMIERGIYRLGLALILLFVMLTLGFSVFALSARAVGLEALSWGDVLLGNALAAATMLSYLWRRRPQSG